MSNGASPGSPNPNTQSTGSAILPHSAGQNAASGITQSSGQGLSSSGQPLGQAGPTQAHTGSTSPQPSQRPGTGTIASTPGSPTSSGNPGRLDLSQLDHLIDECRSGQTSKSRTITDIIAILDTSTSSQSEKEKTLDLLLSEISSINRGINGPHSLPAPVNSNNLPRPISVGGNKRALQKETEDFLEHISKASDASLSESDDDEGNSPKRRKLNESDMPWYSSTSTKAYPSNPSCDKTRHLLKRYNRDITNAKFYAKVAKGSPEGIPSAQWERILRGEPVDLDHLLSSLHRITFDEERKGHVGSTEISLGVSDAKRKVQSSSEWSSAWRRATKAITFCFPHRRDELEQYGEYIEGEFAAKHSSAHSRIIVYDIAIRNEVGGGQNYLLTDHHRFTRLYSAIVATDGVEYNSGGAKRKGGKDKANQSNPGKPEICNNFNSSSGCKFSDRECRYKHLCKGCNKPGHTKDKCPTKEQS